MGALKIGSFMLAGALTFALGINSCFSEEEKKEAAAEGAKKEDKKAPKPENGRRNRQGWGGGGGFPGMFGNRTTTSFIKRMLSNALSTRKVIEVEDLLTAHERSYVLDTPPGGVSNFSSRGKGWPVEKVFEIEKETQKKLEALRKEYDKEVEEYQKFLNRFHAMAAREALDLRWKYEAKANELLKGEKLERKQAVDKKTLAYFKERDLKTEGLNDKADAMVKKVTEGMKKAQEDGGGWEGQREVFAEGRTFMEEAREALGDLSKASLEGIKNILTTDEREKFEGLLKTVTEENDRRRGGWGRRGGRRGGREGRKEQKEKKDQKKEPVAPPAAPKEEF